MCLDASSPAFPPVHALHDLRSTRYSIFISRQVVQPPYVPRRQGLLSRYVEKAAVHPASSRALHRLRHAHPHRSLCARNGDAFSTRMRADSNVSALADYSALHALVKAVLQVDRVLPDENKRHNRARCKQSSERCLLAAGLCPALPWPVLAVVGEDAPYK